MRHAMPSRFIARRALARHRPRSPTWSRTDRSQARASDIVLALLGFSLLGALALYAAIALIGRSAPL